MRNLEDMLLAKTFLAREPAGVGSRSIKHRIARRGHPHGSRLGHIRYVVERSFAWLHRHGRLATCYERRPDLHDALLSLGCSIICWRRLTDWRSF
jgi:hypothetical protein